MSIFESIIGNASVKKYLQLLCDKQIVPHLLLFSGIRGVGKGLFAKALATHWLGSPLQMDLHTFSPEGKTGMHSIARLRRLIDEVHLAPFSSGKKAFIIDDADRMLPTSANALLKTLEEPPRDTLIILVTNALERMLPTIVSRCQIVRFCPLSVDEMALGPQSDELQQRLFQHLSQRRSYHDISQEAKECQKLLETKRKAREAELKSQFATSLKESSPKERQLIEQEIDGALTLSWQDDVSKLFLYIQAFFLELERLQARAPLLFEHHKELLIQAYDHGRMMPLQLVAQSLQQAKQAVDRSTPIQNVLESLLLRLN